jgi:hypothetical protein
MRDITHYSPYRDELALIHAYNKACREDTWVTYSRPGDTSQWGGVSARFINFDPMNSDLCILKWANGDTETVPLSCVTIRVQL